MIEQAPTAAIIDNGSNTLKAGLSSESIPNIIFPTVVGRTKQVSQAPIRGIDDKGPYIGDDAYGNRGILKMSYPIEYGIIYNWEDMEITWSHCFYRKLRINPKEHPVLLTEIPMNPKAQREKMVQTMFESFDVPAFFTQITHVLSLYASGRTTGIVLDCGDIMTRAVPIYDGYSLPHALAKMEIAGKALDEYMVELLAEIGLDWKTMYEKESARDVKEKLCYVALDFDEELKTSKQPCKSEMKYILPDGQEITMNDQLFRCPEILFQPGKWEKGFIGIGIHDMINRSITNCDESLRKELYDNIVLSGGTTKIKGITDRLKKELTGLAPPNTQVSVITPEDRDISAWVGGSILANLSTFQTFWVTKDEYKESGPAIVHRKCY